MNWNTNEFIWLDWVILAVGVVAIVWAIYRAIKKDKEKMKGADSQDYLFGKGEPWYIIGAAIFAANIGSEHLVWTCRNWSQRWCRDGSLGNAGMDDSDFGMAVCSFLSTAEQQDG